jgi:hypothetical protein
MQHMQVRPCKFVVEQNSITGVSRLKYVQENEVICVDSQSLYTPITLFRCSVLAICIMPAFVSLSIPCPQFNADKECNAT